MSVRNESSSLDELSHSKLEESLENLNARDDKQFLDVQLTGSKNMSQLNHSRSQASGKSSKSSCENEDIEFDLEDHKAKIEQVRISNLVPTEQEQELMDIKLKNIRYWLILIAVAQILNFFILAP